MKYIIFALVTISFTAQARVLPNEKNLLTSMDKTSASSIKVEKGAEVVLEQFLKNNPKQFYELSFVCQKSAKGLKCRPASLK